MKRLFSGDDGYTERSEELDRELTAAIEPIMKKWTAQGYSIRDATLVAYGVVGELGAVIALKNATARRKELTQAGGK